MRAANGAKYPEKAADPIIVHADIRRMLLTMKSLVEGSRALSTFASLQLDKKHHEDEAERRKADDLLAFLIPITKGFLTEAGFEAAYWGMQSFGGAGFIHETGMEQYLRDARITSIYEGTNTIQANDLLRRKVLGTKGALLSLFLREVDVLCHDLKEHPELAYQAEALKALRKEWEELSLNIGQRTEKDADEAAGAAFDYLMYSGYASLAYFWGRMSKVASIKVQTGGADAPFYKSKLQTARFYFERILPRTRTLAVTLKAPASTLMEIADDGFTF